MYNNSEWFIFIVKIVHLNYLKFANTKFVRQSTISGWTMCNYNIYQITNTASPNLKNTFNTIL